MPTLVYIMELHCDGWPWATEALSTSTAIHVRPHFFCRHLFGQFLGQNAALFPFPATGATLLQYGNTHENFGGFGALPVAPVSEAEGRVTDLWVGAQLPKHAHHPTHTPFEQLAVHYDASAFCMLFKLTVRRWWPEVSVGARLPVPRMFESPARALQDTGSASVGYF
jgi:hypothetical protein